VRRYHCCGSRQPSPGDEARCSEGWPTTCPSANGFEWPGRGSWLCVNCPVPLRYFPAFRPEQRSVLGCIVGGVHRLSISTVGRLSWPLSLPPSIRTNPAPRDPESYFAHMSGNMCFSIRFDTSAGNAESLGHCTSHCESIDVCPADRVHLALHKRLIAARSFEESVDKPTLLHSRKLRSDDPP